MTGGGQQITVPLSLLGQGRLASLGDRFRNGGGELNWSAMLLVSATLAIAITIVWIVSRHIRRKEMGGYHNHRSLFRELCRAHRLGWLDRRLLMLVALRQGIVVPARLFVEPERFEADRLDGMKERQRRRIAKLCETLFHASAETEL